MKAYYYNTATATTTADIQQSSIIYESDLINKLANDYKKLSSDGKMKFLDMILKIDI